MFRVLAGIETEYGLSIQGRGAEDQVEDSAEFVRAFPARAFVGWDYRFESPRADLRGFKLDRLAFDPEDAKFDTGRVHQSDQAVRSDRVLPNGARFYNDHGHPEYATPECWSLEELTLHDMAGEEWLRRTAEAYEALTGLRTKVFKNNSDGHGASYGTHESYLVPRPLGFEALYRAVMPMLVARIALCGAGKVGSEALGPCDYQLSQRADFFVEAANAETLYRRPVFNTRDEPHGDPGQWIRLHVISGDANMLPAATHRKAGLVKVALLLAMAEEAPVWRIPSPPKAAQSVSRSHRGEGRIDLEGANWTTARQIIESYTDAFRRTFVADPEASELLAVCDEAESLLADLAGEGDRAARRIDWLAKKRLLDEFRESEGLAWNDPTLRSLDLAYHDLDPDEGLVPALAQMARIDPFPEDAIVRARMTSVFESNRARVRSQAVKEFLPSLAGVSWGSLSLSDEGREVRLALDPGKDYGPGIENARAISELETVVKGDT
ncbi:MAG: proteasome accessory factor PafA2 family protein [Fimbriimonadaceae bacterium]|nr:proteasome accessory factor PafA2 family protein [Fimbriimonadaceae bacterium]QYK56366.1 MAG: proteasome accessory factor PafA2 family protein [Fimbriimonadaceae bacterium]